MTDVETKIAALKFSIEMCQATRLATIEECAKVAEAWFEKEFAGTLGSEGIGKAVRSLKSVPMDKEG